MRVTVQHTLDIKDMPTYIGGRFEEALLDLKAILDMAQGAKEESDLGRFIDSSELVETLRQKMTIIDANLGEIQSLNLSYEKMRLAKNMPEQGEPSRDLDE